MKKTDNLEKQVEEFNYQLAINKRIAELDDMLKKAEDEIKQAQQYLQQRNADVIALTGAKHELTKLIQESSQPATPAS